MVGCAHRSALYHWDLHTGYDAVGAERGILGEAVGCYGKIPYGKRVYGFKMEKSDKKLPNPQNESKTV